MFKVLSLQSPFDRVLLHYHRLSRSFAVSGSQDCTVKLWNLKPITKWSQVSQTTLSMYIIVK